MGSFGTADKPMGYIRMRVFLEVGQEYEWTVFAYQLRMNALHRMKKFKRNLLKKGPKLPAAPPDFPLHIQIDQISVLDLTAVHLMYKNSPRVQVECGSFLEITQEQTSAGDNAFWEDLGWSIYLVRRLVL